MKKLFGLVALLSLSFILPARAETEMTFGSFAINGVFQGKEKEMAAYKAFFESHDIDCSLYDFAGANQLGFCD